MRLSYVTYDIAEFEQFNYKLPLRSSLLT